ncbi:MAG: helix-turn-helix domain-containing protein, partial [Solirubrobacteraceae bacterium]
VLLNRGESVERIAKRFGKGPSPVSYWMKKYGLTSPYAEKHATKGGIERERLLALVSAGLSITEIAAAVGRSKGTVRHWLRRYELRTRAVAGRKTIAKKRAAREAGALTTEMMCPHHGETTFILGGRGYYRCKRCRVENVGRHRQKLKATLVAEAGGCCSLCGYDRDVRALQFHHHDPSLKRVDVGGRGVTYSIYVLRV